jgi:hypothetical protein
MKGSFIVVKTKEGNKSYHESDLKVLNKEGIKVSLDFPMEEEYHFESEVVFESEDNELQSKVQKAKEEIEKIKKAINYSGRPSETMIKALMNAEKEYKKLTNSLNEAKNENKPIGKPMRDSSGGKAYKVYVRDPKTKKIKTVRFGSGGLKAKINNPKARKAFAKRHDCKNKKDRTKASYWSCRLPSYAKLLGLKSNFSGFW